MIEESIKKHVSRLSTLPITGYEISAALWNELGRHKPFPTYKIVKRVIMT